MFERPEELVCRKICFIRTHYSNPKLKANTFVHTPACTAKFTLQNVLLDFPFVLHERSLFLINIILEISIFSRNRVLHRNYVVFDSLIQITFCEEVFALQNR